MANVERFVEWGQQHGYDKERARHRGEKLGYAVKTYLFLSRQRRYVSVVEVANWLADERGFSTWEAALRYSRRLVYALREAELVKIRCEGNTGSKLPMEVRALQIGDTGKEN